jgi:hypothetical protein
MMDKAGVAAIAGALCYLGGEQTAATPAVRSGASLRAMPSLWALYGRQHQMDLRAMMQRREIRRTR